MECKYMFMFTLKNLTRKGLIKNSNMNVILSRNYQTEKLMNKANERVPSILSHCMPLFLTGVN